MLWSSVRIVFIMWLLAVAESRFRKHKRHHRHHRRTEVKRKEFVPDIDSYCGSELCPNAEHIGCKGRPFQYGTKCSIDAELLELKEDNKTFILDQFNELRNQVARGHYNGLTAAGRMATMQWDDELAYLAEMHIIQCSMNHDLCRNTQRFKNAGQTTAYKGVMGNVPKLEDIIRALINIWFSESTFINMLDILEYKGPQVGDNFVQVVMENANRIGCATLQQTKYGWLQTYLTCNYAHAPVIQKPIFTATAKAGEACIKGMNTVYTSLCHIDEDYENAGGPVEQHNSVETTEQPHAETTDEDDEDETTCATDFDDTTDEDETTTEPDEDETTNEPGEDETTTEDTAAVAGNEAPAEGVPIPADGEGASAAKAEANAAPAEVPAEGVPIPADGEGASAAGAEANAAPAQGEVNAAPAEVPAGRSIKKAIRPNYKASVEGEGAVDLNKKENFNVPEEETSTEQTRNVRAIEPGEENKEEEEEEENEENVAEDDKQEKEKRVMEESKEVSNEKIKEKKIQDEATEDEMCDAEDMDQNLKSPSSEISDEAVLPYNIKHKPIQLTDKRRKELLQRKFGQFLALIHKAERFAEHRNIVIITSNHEVDDMKNIKFGNAGRKEKIAERTRKVRAYRRSRRLRVRSGILQGSQGRTKMRSVNGQAQWQRL